MFLSVKNLEASYGTLKVLAGINLGLEKGDFGAIVGPNGSGKSTTLKCICGLLKPDKGEILFKGKSVLGLSAPEIAKQGIILVPQGRRVLHGLSVKENLEIGGFLINGKKLLEERLKNIFEIFPVLEKYKNHQATFLSGGQQQMLSVGRALMLSPELLILDEPSLGLSPVAIEEIFEKIIKINKLGTTILMVEQNVKLALRVSSKMFVLQTGRVAFSGLPNELSEEKLSSLYFGH